MYIENIYWRDYFLVVSNIVLDLNLLKIMKLKLL